MLRWLQFGVFSPIFRTHGASQEGNERRIWKFGNFDKLLECVNLRYELMPYIYTAARQAYDTGISICRPLYYEWPEENEAYRQEGEYMFGDNILVSPIVTTSNDDSRTFHKTWLPEGRWYDVCRNRLLDGGQTLSEYYADDEIPYFIKAGSIVVCNPQINNLKTTTDKLLIKVIPGDNGSTNLYEDAGDTQDYQNGGFTTTHIAQQRTAAGISISIDARNGSYEGMSAERAYELHLLLTNKPERVTIDGVETSDWSYDATRHLVIVNIGTTPCEQQVVVNVEYDVSGIANVATVEVVAEHYYDLSGRPCAEKPHGAYIVCRTWSDGSVTTQKEF